MNSKINLNYSINLESCTLDNISALIKEMVPLILEDILELSYWGLLRNTKSLKIPVLSINYFV